MTLTLHETEKGRIIIVTVSGKLTKEDYQHFLPRIEKDIEENSKVRILFQMHDFHGWQTAALWEDIKFDMKHFSDIERLAMIGDKQWEKGMSVFYKPFTTAEIRFFRPEEINAGRLRKALKAQTSNTIPLLPVFCVLYLYIPSPVPLLFYNLQNDNLQFPQAVLQ